MRMRRRPESSATFVQDGGEQLAAGWPGGAGRGNRGVVELGVGTVDGAAVEAGAVGDVGSWPVQMRGRS